MAIKGKAQYSPFRRGADGRQSPSYLTRAPIPSRNQEMRQLAKEREEYYLRKAAGEFERFIAWYGTPDGFSLAPKSMELCELKMAQAAQAGDQHLVKEIGEKYLQRVMAYVDLWRLRVARRQEDPNAGALEPQGEALPTLEADAQAQAPAPVDALEVRSTRIPAKLKLAGFDDVRSTSTQGESLLFDVED